MANEWGPEEFLEFHYSRMARRRVIRQSGISDPRYIGGLEQKSRREAERLMYTPPEVQLTEKLLPVTIHEAWD